MPLELAVLGLLNGLQLDWGLGRTDSVISLFLRKDLRENLNRFELLSFP